MTKTEDLLNELIYRIDDITYDFYTESNSVIATKKNPERLIDFRDHAVTTLNDMNVRSLEIISRIKDLALAEERVNILIEKNQKIVASSMEVIHEAPARNDFVNDVSNLANNLYEGAKETVQKIEQSDAYAKVKDQTKKGFEKAKESIDNFVHDPRVQEGVEEAKEKSKEVLDAGAKLVKENTKKLADWIESHRQHVEEELKDFKEDAEDVYDDVKDAALGVYEDVSDKTEEVLDDIGHKAEDAVDEVKKSVKDLDEAADQEMKEALDKLEGENVE